MRGPAPRQTKYRYICDHGRGPRGLTGLHSFAERPEFRFAAISPPVGPASRAGSCGFRNPSAGEDTWHRKLEPAASSLQRSVGAGYPSALAAPCIRKDPSLFGARRDRHDQRANPSTVYANTALVLLPTGKYRNSPSKMVRYQDDSTDPLRFFCLLPRQGIMWFQLFFFAPLGTRRRVGHPMLNPPKQLGCRVATRRGRYLSLQSSSQSRDVRAV